LGQRPRRQLQFALIAAIVAILAAVAGITGYLLRQPSTTSQPVTPVAVTALEGLLLSPEQLNTAMGTTGMEVKTNATTMSDSAASVSDKACLPLSHNVETAVYDGSGWTAVLRQTAADPRAGQQGGHMVEQAVVLFPSARDVGAFFTASTRSWSACSNRQFQFTSVNAGGAVTTDTVGPVSNTNGTLSATVTIDFGGFGTWTCDRALAVANNVAIDVDACIWGQNQPDAAVNIAHQIAAKVFKT
jgi:serine/threonine-protein kinase